MGGPRTHAGFTREQVTRHLRAYLTLVEHMTPKAASDKMGIPLKILKGWHRSEDLYLIPDGPWQDVVDGKTWVDMPGHDPFMKRCNFALWRRGELSLESPPSGQWYGKVKKAHTGGRRRSNRIERAASDIEEDAADVDLSCLREEEEEGKWSGPFQKKAS